MTEFYLGLMSGTSADGVDAVVAEFDGENFRQLRGTLHHEYSVDLRKRLLEISVNQPALSLRELAELDAAVAEAFASAANRLLLAEAINSEQITALGSHGQTIFHDGPRGLTIQLGDPNRIAEITGITTVGDFRRRDLALGGQGAPLVPGFHQSLFGNTEEKRCVLNIGGIANITLLPDAATATVVGFDTGPGNALMDEWMQLHCGALYDRNGEFAASGRVHTPLVEALLADPYFAKAPPKSTGRDYFRLAWMHERFPAVNELAIKDVQASLCDVTALSITESISAVMPLGNRVLVCGGGARNSFLMRRLGVMLPELEIEPTDTYGLQAEWIEAAAFAWLAMRRMHGLPGNLPAVTGARASAVLGGVYPGRKP